MSLAASTSALAAMTFDSPIRFCVAWKNNTSGVSNAISSEKARQAWSYGTREEVLQLFREPEVRNEIDTVSVTTRHVSI